MEIWHRIWCYIRKGKEEPWKEGQLKCVRERVCEKEGLENWENHGEDPELNSWCRSWEWLDVQQREIKDSHSSKGGSDEENSSSTCSKKQSLETFHRTLVRGKEVFSLHRSLRSGARCMTGMWDVQQTLSLSDQGTWKRLIRPCSIYHERLLKISPQKAWQEICNKTLFYQSPKIWDFHQGISGMRGMQQKDGS